MGATPLASIDAVLHSVLWKPMTLDRKQSHPNTSPDTGTGSGGGSGGGKLNRAGSSTRNRPGRSSSGGTIERFQCPNVSCWIHLLECSVSSYLKIRDNPKDTADFEWPERKDTAWFASVLSSLPDDAYSPIYLASCFANPVPFALWRHIFIKTMSDGKDSEFSLSPESISRLDKKLPDLTASLTEDDESFVRIILAAGRRADHTWALYHCIPESVALRITQGVAPAVYTSGWEVKQDLKENSKSQTACSGGVGSGGSESGSGSAERWQFHEELYNRIASCSDVGIVFPVSVARTIVDYCWMITRRNGVLSIMRSPRVIFHALERSEQRFYEWAALYPIAMRYYEGLGPISPKQIMRKFEDPRTSGVPSFFFLITC